jgi:hydroxymethylglutaryl-CoA lyase
MPLRGYVSCVIACPYDGPTPPAKVAEVTARLFELGCHEVSLGDTIGAGEPETVAAMLGAVLRVAPAGRLAGHFHDTGGQAVANVEAALALGLRVFDAAAGGLGGCPFAPGAPGNVDTLHVAERLAVLGWETGLDLPRLRTASAFARSLRA